MTGPQNRYAPRRAGFTLIELLVAMALIIFIMAILAEAFEAGISTFRRLKAVSDMNERLRSASSILRRYLAADHFEGKKRLSDLNFWKDGPPQEGFFRLLQEPESTTARTLLEGTDSDGNPSYRSTKHLLHFAVKLRGNNPDDFFQTSLLPTGSPIFALGHPDARYGSATIYGSSWAEVAFFLRATGENTRDPQDPTRQLPLHTLHMRQRLAVPNADTFNPDAANKVLASTYLTANNGTFVEMSFGLLSFPASGGTPYLLFNSPQYLTMPARRLGALRVDGTPRPTGATSPSEYPILAEEPIGNPGAAKLDGNDILLTDVLSMDVRLLVDDTGTFKTLWDCGYTRQNTSFPANVAVFDTWSSRSDALLQYQDWATSTGATRIPFYNASNPLRIRAIQITLRVWDRNTLQTRQTSIIQDL